MPVIGWAWVRKGIIYFILPCLKRIGKTLCEIAMYQPWWIDDIADIASIVDLHQIEVMIQSVGIWFQDTHDASMGQFYVYLYIHTWKPIQINQMQVNITYMDGMGYTRHFLRCSGCTPIWHLGLRLVDLWGEVQGVWSSLAAVDRWNREPPKRCTNRVNEPSTGHTQIDMSWKFC